MEAYRHAAAAREGIRYAIIWAKENLRSGTDSWWTRGPEYSLALLRLAIKELDTARNGLRGFAAAKHVTYDGAAFPLSGRTAYRPLRLLRKYAEELDTVRECLHFGCYHQALQELNYIIAGVMTQVIVLNRLKNQKERKNAV